MNERRWCYLVSFTCNSRGIMDMLHVLEVTLLQLRWRLRRDFMKRENSSHHRRHFRCWAMWPVVLCFCIPSVIFLNFSSVRASVCVLLQCRNVCWWRKGQNCLYYTRVVVLCEPWSSLGFLWKILNVFRQLVPLLGWGIFLEAFCDRRLYMWLGYLFWSWPTIQISTQYIFSSHI